MLLFLYRHSAGRLDSSWRDDDVWCGKKLLNKFSYFHTSGCNGLIHVPPRRCRNDSAVGYLTQIFINIKVEKEAELFLLLYLSSILCGG